MEIASSWKIKRCRAHEVDRGAVPLDPAAYRRQGVAPQTGQDTKTSLQAVSTPWSVRAIKARGIRTLDFEGFGSSGSFSHPMRMNMALLELTVPPMIQVPLHLLHWGSIYDPYVRLVADFLTQ